MPIHIHIYIPMGNTINQGKGKTSTNATHATLPGYHGLPQDSAPHQAQVP